jgi:hypothetical protein
MAVHHRTRHPSSLRKKCLAINDNPRGTANNPTEREWETLSTSVVAPKKDSNEPEAMAMACGSSSTPPFSFEKKNQK